MDVRYAQANFSLALQKKVESLPKVDLGFKNWFPDQIESTRGFEFYVEKYGRDVAVDITRGEKGEVVREDDSTQKGFTPPFFEKMYHFSAQEEYEPIFGIDDATVSNSIYKELVNKTAKGLVRIDNSFARREELQRAQALLTGIVTLKNGDNIDFKRNAASLVAYDASFGWDVDANNPEVIIIQLIEEMIKEGKVDATQPFDIIAGSNAFSAFKNNPVRQKQGDIKDQDYMTLSTGAPMKDLTPQGSYSAGNYRVNFWGYTGYYDDPDTGITTSYMDADKIIILPRAVPFKQVYCGTDGWSGDPMVNSSRPKVIKAKRNIMKLRDIHACSEYYVMRTSTVPSLYQVNWVGTAQVTSGAGGQG